MEDTEWLRGAAPQWSLAGDERLLQTLQELHKRIMCKCEQTSSKLEEMVSTLDDAALQLSNVNNKFLALSSGQFVERRVLDDDADVTSAEPAPALNKPTSAPSEDLAPGLLALSRAHERVAILPDSDTESGSADEEEHRVILKLKDMYESRPLPHIIGTKQFNSKWHAGLIRSDSDSDSSASVRYDLSDEDTEGRNEGQEDRGNGTGELTQISSSSCDLPSESSDERSAVLTKAAQAQAVADTLAKAGQVSRGDDAEEVHQDLAANKPRPLYAPYKPTPGVLFSEEPPPLDDSADSADDDIFAELHRTSENRTAGARLAADSSPGRNKQLSQTSNVRASPETAAPDTVMDKPTNVQSATVPVNYNSKKPMGGKSLFGSNMMSESIGAAILKRSQRQASRSDDSDTYETNTPKNVHAGIDKTIVNEEEPIPATERDIFDDLFAKSEKMTRKFQIQSKMVVNNTPEKKKVDLFKDNIFDDIDDIFTNHSVNVQSNTIKTDNDKPLFEDDNDIFSDIAKPVVTKPAVKTETKHKPSLFDSDDDLFSDKPLSANFASKSKESKTPIQNKDLIKETYTNKNEIKVNTAIEEPSKHTENSDFTETWLIDDIFAEKPKETTRSKIISGSNTPTVSSKSLFGNDDNEDLFKDKVSTDTKVINKLEGITNSELVIDDIFKSETAKDNDEDIFVSAPKQNEDVLPTSNNRLNEDNKKTTPPALIEEDDYDLFINVSCVVVNEKKKPQLKPEDEKFLQQVSNKKEMVNSPDMFEDDASEIFIKSIENLHGCTVQGIETIHENIKDSIVRGNQLMLNTEPSVETENLQFSEDEYTQNVDDNEIDLFKSQNNNIQDNDDDKLFLTTTKSKGIEVIKEDNLFTTIGEPHILQTQVKYEIPIPPADDSNIESHFPNIDFVYKTSILDNMKQTDTNDNVTDNINEMNKHEDFEDIFDDQPPEFEKPKEPKKSKNVNALFDDDSDDEALFFKKTDPTLDEKPHEPIDNSKSNVFGLFQDEPPAIDPNLSDPFIANEIERPLLDEDFVRTGDEILRRDVSNDKVKKSTTRIEKEAKDNSNETSQSQVEVVTDSTDGTQKEPKKIGKLKPMNFNINVSGLLPGASPKKVQKPQESYVRHSDRVGVENTQEQNDGQFLSTKKSEEINKSYEDKNLVDSYNKLVKSVSFDGKPESTVLDNTLSKDRAKIQVKRRPSTRRARLAAVKNSGVNFSDDSTDNSSLLDDAIVNKPETSNADNVSDEEKKPEPTVEKHQNIKDIKHEQNVSNKDTKVEVVIKEPNFMKNINETLRPCEQINVSSTEQNNFTGTYGNDNKTKVIKSNSSTSKDVKSKIIYVMEDDDIFENPKLAVSESSNIDKPKHKQPNPLSILNDDDDDDIFKNMSVASKATPISNINIGREENEKVIKTLGHVYTDTKIPGVKHNKSLILSDDSDDDIFKKFSTVNTKSNIANKHIDRTLTNADATQKVDIPNVNKTEERNDNKTKKLSIFDDLTDDESDLFKAKKTAVKKPTVFNSDSDEELFSGKSKVKPEQKVKKNLDTDKAVKKPSIVKKDVKPSLFGDDDDDDELFGGRKKPEALPASIPTESKTKSKPAMQDPLSFISDEE